MRARGYFIAGFLWVTLLILLALWLAQPEYLIGKFR